MKVTYFPEEEKKLGTKYPLSFPTSKTKSERGRRGFSIAAVVMVGIIPTHLPTHLLLASFFVESVYVCGVQGSMSCDCEGELRGVKERDGGRFKKTFVFLDMVENGYWIMELCC